MLQSIHTGLKQNEYERTSEYVKTNYFVYKCGLLYISSPINDKKINEQIWTVAYSN